MPAGGGVFSLAASGWDGEATSHLFRHCIFMLELFLFLA